MLKFTQLISPRARIRTQTSLGELGPCLYTLQPFAAQGAISERPLHQLFLHDVSPELATIPVGIFPPGSSVLSHLHCQLALGLLLLGDFHLREIQSLSLKKTQFPFSPCVTCHNVFPFTGGFPPDFESNFKICNMEVQLERPYFEQTPSVPFFSLSRGQSPP